MDELTRLRCELFIENKDQIKKVFSWDGGLIHLACAGIYAAKDKKVDEGTLQFCKDMMKQKVSIFSNFRSTVKSPVASMLAASDNPEQTLDQGLQVYELLKQDFWGSIYLPLAAMIIAQMANQNECGRVAARTKLLYERMKLEHRGSNRADIGIPRAAVLNHIHDRFKGLCCSEHAGMRGHRLHQIDAGLEVHQIDFTQLVGGEGSDQYSVPIDRKRHIGQRCLGGLVILKDGETRFGFCVLS